MDPLLMIVLGGAALLLVKPDILGPAQPPTPPPGSPLALGGVGGAAAGIIVGITQALTSISDRQIAELREDNVRAARGVFGRLFTLLQAPEHQDTYYALFASDHHRIFGDYWFNAGTARGWLLGNHNANIGRPAINMILADLNYGALSLEHWNEILDSFPAGWWLTDNLLPLISVWFRGNWITQEIPELLDPTIPVQPGGDGWTPTVDPGDIRSVLGVTL